MHHRQLKRCIRHTVFTVISYITEPNPTVSFDDLVRGLGDMVAHFVDGELQRVGAD